MFRVILPVIEESKAQIKNKRASTAENKRIDDDK